jgi:hypothetical protein
MNGRVQDPVLGRFISADPFVQAPFHTQSHNRYSYVWNNPASLVDPSGFQTEDEEEITNCSGGNGIPSPDGSGCIDADLKCMIENYPRFSNPPRMPGVWVYSGNPFANDNYTATNVPHVSPVPNNPCPSCHSSDVRVPGEFDDGIIFAERLMMSLDLPPLPFAASETQVTENEGFYSVTTGGYDIGPFSNVGGSTEMYAPDGSLIQIQGGTAPVAGPLRARGLTTPGRFFRERTTQQARDALGTKFGPPRSSRPGADTFYNPRTQRSYNVHTDPAHGSPHVDIRRRGPYADRQYPTGGGN